MSEVSKLFGAAVVETFWTESAVAVALNVPELERLTVDEVGEDN